ncbi:hypothetical protein [Bacteroides cellulosilyticus]|jgi:hypothetical protein|nr:hypothetical protein [Bacteroides cellulosilyticus]DAQ92545.1 MAG TPA: hypothetical protein [Bacteriophage sp.]
MIQIKKNKDMQITEQKTTVLTAADGKVLRRISDGHMFGKEIYLGYTYYLGGKPLDEPLMELPEHYEEVDEPEESAAETAE